MVPPTMARVEFVFEVNGKLEMASDLPSVSVRATAQTSDVSIELRNGSVATTRRPECIFCAEQREEACTVFHLVAWVKAHCLGECQMSVGA